MTDLPPDPDPENAPGVELGGGVTPGDTPPDSAQTSATSNPDPPIHQWMTPTSIVTVVAIGLFVLLFVTTAVLLALKIIGVLG